MVSAKTGRLGFEQLYLFIYLFYNNSCWVCYYHPACWSCTPPSLCRRAHSGWYPLHTFCCTTSLQVCKYQANSLVNRVTNNSGKTQLHHIYDYNTITEGAWLQVQISRTFLPECRIWRCSRRHCSIPRSRRFDWSPNSWPFACSDKF